MRIYLHIIKPLLAWFQTKTSVPEAIQFPKWVLPTITYILTLATGLWLGIMIQQPRIRRYQLLTTDAQNRKQLIADSLRIITQIAVKDHTIALKDETILNLRQQIRSDSIAHLTELQAIRAINIHLAKKR